MVNYYSIFILNLANMMTPLYELVRKNVKLKWSERCQSAFEFLKSKVTSDKVLVHFNPRLPALLSTDASNKAIAGTIAQQHGDGSKKSIAFISRVLTQIANVKELVICRASVARVRSKSLPLQCLIYINLLERKI